MNVRALWFLARKDLTRNLAVLLLVILAVGSGALVLVPARGLMEGFIQSFYATTIDVSTGHISIVPSGTAKYLDDAKEKRDKIMSLSEVKGVSVRVLDRGFLSKGDKAEATPVVGVDPETEADVVILPEKITGGSYIRVSEMNKVLVGKVLASSLNLKVGDETNLLLANGKRGKFIVGGIYSTGFQQLDKQVYMPRQELERLISQENKASEIVVRLDSIEKTDSAKKSVAKLGIDGKIETWKDRIGFVEGIRRNFEVFLRIIIFLIIIASCTTIAVLMYTNIEHRMKFIGVLKAIGSPNTGILELFVLEGLIIGILGTLVGETLGGLITWYLSNHPLQFTMGVVGGTATQVGIKTAFSVDYFILPAVIILPAVFLASLYPAWRAARMNIIEAVWRG